MTTAAVSSAMSPIDLPATPQEALCRDLLRPRITASISVTPAPSTKRSHPGERPHGGEPTIRRDASAFASSSDSSGRFTTWFHEPWLDSASTVIVSGIILDWKTLAPRIYWRRS